MSTPEDTAAAILKRHAIQPDWFRSGEQILPLIAEGIRADREQTKPSTAEFPVIVGKIVLADGSVSEFSIALDGGDSRWFQWGATTERLGRTVDHVEAMFDGLVEAGVVIDEEGENG